jgi:hypothetical protein
MITGRFQWPRGLRPLAFWECGFESRCGRGCLSVVSVVCCYVEVSATDRPPVQGSHTVCGVCVCVCVWGGGTESDQGHQRPTTPTVNS